MEVTIEMRECTKCHKLLPATKEFFHVMKRGKFGLRARCKECRTIHYKERCLPEGMRKCTTCHLILPATPENFYAEKTCKFGLASRCRECRTTYAKERYTKNSKRNRENAKKYRLENPEKIRKYNEMYRLENPEKIREYSKMYYLENRAAISAKDTRRKLRKLNATIVNFNINKWLKTQRPFRCYLCGKKIKDDKYHIEHRIPLSRGGVHATFNLGIACPRCNAEKYTKTPWEYLKDKFCLELMLGVKPEKDQ